MFVFDLIQVVLQNSCYILSIFVSSSVNDFDVTCLWQWGTTCTSILLISTGIYIIYLSIQHALYICNAYCTVLPHLLGNSKNWILAQDIYNIKRIKSGVRDKKTYKTQ